jgi:hypothetical protein
MKTLIILQIKFSVAEVMPVGISIFGDFFQFSPKSGVFLKKQML